MTAKLLHRVWVWEGRVVKKVLESRISDFVEASARAGCFSLVDAFNFHHAAKGLKSRGVERC